MPNYRPEAERFWEKVAKAGPTECWMWQASVNAMGYGQFVRTGRVLVYAHRWSYEQSHGPIADGMSIDHMCHVPSCVNPAHLRAVSPRQNLENHSGPTRANTSGYRGVYFETRTQRWVAQVRGPSRDESYFQRFANIEDAAAAVVEARNRLHTHNDLDRDHPVPTLR